MVARKKFVIIFLILVLLFIGFDLAPLLQKESLKEISFSDFRLSIGPFLSGIAVFMSYRAGIKKDRNQKTNTPSL